jgi:hypothetical protein
VSKLGWKLYAFGAFLRSYTDDRERINDRRVVKVRSWLNTTADVEARQASALAQRYWKSRERARG